MGRSHRSAGLLSPYIIIYSVAESLSGELKYSQCFLPPHYMPSDSILSRPLSSCSPKRAAAMFIIHRIIRRDAAAGKRPNDLVVAHRPISQCLPPATPIIQQARWCLTGEWKKTKTEDEKADNVQVFLCQFASSLGRARRQTAR